ncbi:hypothetical protein JTE90_015569 [Oedothorax gibbosus]|uniref:Uncharacterized protein n=1 Tax=Oedothorax gibbosus TaxID=931172 RepID=A0AAV6UIJ6_9ARAC|nr:hypothetical protein JTE90_015569 [Oedothorax gibbosus]
MNVDTVQKVRPIAEKADGFLSLTDQTPPLKRLGNAVAFTASAAIVRESDCCRLRGVSDASPREVLESII